MINVNKFNSKEMRQLPAKVQSEQDVSMNENILDKRKGIMGHCSHLKGTYLEACVNFFSNRVTVRPTDFDTHTSSSLSLWSGHIIFRNVPVKPLRDLR